MKQTLTAIIAATLLTSCTSIQKPTHTPYEIYSKILTRSHTYREKAHYQSEHPHNIFNLTQDQFTTFSCIYDYFQNPTNFAKLERELEQSVRDNVEYGGYVLAQDNTLTFIKSCTHSSRYTTTVQFPSFTISGKIIGLYHYHPLDSNSTVHTGPSDIDLASQEHNTTLAGIVISKLPKRNFNVDIFFAQKEPIVIDLGNYSY